MTEMSDVTQALRRFLSGFGIPVYQDDSIPSDAVFPYMTWVPAVYDWDDSGILLVRVWDHGGPDFGMTRLAGVVDRISAGIGEGGVSFPAGSSGYVHVSRGSPWVQIQPMPGSVPVRVAYLNFNIRTIVV